MARAEQTKLIDTFDQFYRKYYSNEIGDLAQNYPGEQRSLYVDWKDLYRFDSDLANEYRRQPKTHRKYAELALQHFEVPVDVGFQLANVRVTNLSTTTDMGEIRSRHINTLIGIQGTVDRVWNAYGPRPQ